MHFENQPAEEILRWAIDSFGDALAFVSSFQDEDMLILDMGARLAPGIRVFTLDTGRLPEETYQMMETVRARYGLRIEAVCPDAAELESMLTTHGPNLFRQSAALRKLCCEIRKVHPLERKLTEFRAGVYGLRREQSAARSNVPKVEERDGRVKVSPVADWTSAQVDEYIRQHDVPRHPLYARNYTSIGCAPCTRAVEPGEQGRSGRWWWEQDATKECGLHVSR
ncbi:MAG: phosphoadenylyl-sulfate reductase [Acidobacteriota bacterium]